jgi:hypothetical protein
MNRALVAALIFLAACSNNQDSTINESQKQTRFYDYELSIEFLNPFLGLEKSYFLALDSLTVRNNTFSKEGKLINTERNIRALTKPQLDSVYTYAAELFSVNKQNLTNEPIPRPPSGEGSMARVTFDLRFSGDRYVRDVRKLDIHTENPFSRLYNYILTTQRSR